MARTQEKATKNSGANGVEKTQRLIYIGPNIPGGELDQFRVFKGFPEYLAILKSVPEIRDLFVPIETLAVAREKLQTAGTREAQLFAQVARKIDNKEKGGA